MLKKNKWLILGSIFFLLIQLGYSALLFHRQGNLIVSADDAYGYIFLIKKVGLFRSFFPDVPSFTRSVNFDYLGYSTVFGGISWLFNIPAQTLFSTSFYWGKAILLVSLIFLLKNLRFNDKLTGLILVSMAFYSGNGATHGFFWVVPSFWFFTLLFVLIGITFNRQKVSPILIAFLSALYTTMHQLYSPFLVFWFLLYLTLKIRSKNLSIFPNATKTAIFVLLFFLLFQTTQILWSQLENTKKFYLDKFARAKVLNDADITNLVESDRKIALIPIPVQNKLNPPPPTPLPPQPTPTSLSYDLGPLLKKANKYLPSLATYWQTIVSPILPIYPVIFWFPWWIRLLLKTQDKSIKKYLVIFTIAAATSAIFSWHVFGFRTLAPATSFSYGLIGIIFYLSFNQLRTKTSFIQKTINLSGLFLCPSLLLYYGWINYNSLASYANSNQASWQPEKCIDYIQKNIDKTQNRVFFTSRTGLHAFMANGLHNLSLTPYLGSESPKIIDYTAANSDIFLISETSNIESMTDVPYSPESLDLLKQKLPDRKQETVGCGYFNLIRFIAPKPRT